ncbi:MAG: pitrilysin family protein [Acidimicrobiia bacterium]
MIPGVSPPRAFRVPRMIDEMLANGLRAVVVCKDGAPLTEVRLRVPVIATTADGEATRDLLARTITAGTDRRSQMQLDIDLQSMGARLAAGTTEDALVITGSVPSRRMAEFLRLLSEVVRAATFPDAPVRVERSRLAEEVVLALSQPGVIAEKVFRRRLFGRHPYGLGLPSPYAVRHVTGTGLRALHAQLPSAGAMTVVGDSPPTRLLEAVAKERWVARRRPQPVPSLDAWRRRPLLVVHREGARQTSIRMGGPAPVRDTAFGLANLVFGGYFLSRLASNLREEKGYTYSVHSQVQHLAAASTVTIAADVRTEVTGVAFAEILSELERSEAWSDEEVDNARRYAMGVLSIQAHTKAGLASLIDSLLARGLDLGYLRTYLRELRSVTPAQARVAAAEYLAPSRLTTVMVGDAEHIVPQLNRFGRVVVR